MNVLGKRWKKRGQTRFHGKNGVRLDFRGNIQAKSNLTPFFLPAQRDRGFRLIAKEIESDPIFES